jgi:hypothetical protein
VRVVEAQTIRRHQRAGLTHVRAQLLPQRGVEQVRGGVVPHGRRSVRGIDTRRELAGLARGEQRVAHAGDHAHAVDDALALLVDMRQLRLRPAALDHATVRDLAAGFRVARRAIEHELDLRSAGRRGMLAPAAQREPLGRERVVADELGVLPRAHRRPRRACARRLLLPELARARARVRCSSMARSKPARSTVTSRLLAISSVSSIGKAVGVVQRERLLAADRPRVLQQLLEPAQARLEGLGEAGLLLLHHAQDLGAPRAQLAIVAGEQLDRASRGRRQERLVQREPTPRAPARHRAPQQPAQHVARALVARQRALRDRERQRPRVVRDDARVAQRRRAPLRRGLRQRQHRVHQRREQVGLEDRALPLHDQRQALDPHAGVDSRARERLQASVRLRVELREHQVPELHVAVAASPGLSPQNASGAR